LEVLTAAPKESTKSTKKRTRGEIKQVKNGANFGPPSKGNFGEEAFLREKIQCHEL